MRVLVEDTESSGGNLIKVDRPGEFLGLTMGCDRCDGDDAYAVVRLDNPTHGLFLWVGHPRRVKPVPVVSINPVDNYTADMKAGKWHTNDPREYAKPAAPQGFNPDDTTRET